MDYVERVQQAIDYIEDRLFEPILLQDVAEQAFFSPYHFYRLFQAMAGYTLKEYIPRRRMSEATEMLRTTQISILELAFMCQYESQESFTRAFKKEFGRNPGNFRARKASFRSFLPLDVINNRMKGDIEMADMKPKILAKEAFLVIGPAIRVSTENEENFKRIPLFWEEVMQKDMLRQIPNVINQNTSFGFCMDFDESRFTEFIPDVYVDSLCDEPFHGIYVSRSARFYQRQ